MRRIRDTVQDFGESSSTHGISYIVQRDQILYHRILWLAIVVTAVSFAAYLSFTAYQDWQNDPIITTVSTTALPISQLEYPAITICGQGMATDTLERVLESQFNSYLVEKGYDPASMTKDEKDQLRKVYKDDAYPGLDVDLTEIASMMTAPDPGAAVGAKAVVAAAEAAVTPAEKVVASSIPLIVLPGRKKSARKGKFVDVREIKENLSLVEEGISKLIGGCDPGWISSTTRINSSQVFCYRVVDGLFTNAEAKAYCQSKQSVLLEFDSIQEVEDFARLTNDNHMPLSKNIKSVWLGIHYSENFGYRFSSNQKDPKKVLDYFGKREDGQNCAHYNLKDSKLVPVYCEEKSIAICTKTSEYTRDQLLKDGPRRRKREVDPPKFDIFLNPSKKGEQLELEKKLSQKYRETFGSMNLTYSFPSIFEMLWHSINPCFDIREWTSDYRDEKSTIKRCWWKGVQINCTAIFKTNPTDRGMCCTFNAQAADKIYRETKFSESVARLQKMNINMSFEEENLPDSFLTGREPLPEIGKNRGLTLIIDSHANIASPGTVADDFEGFMSLVSSSNKFPSLTEKGFVVRPGHENLVSMSAVDTIADPAIRAINATKRNCYFNDEYELQMYKKYSQSGCVFECLLNFGRNIPGLLGCTPWFYPSQDTNMCDPWQTNEFIRKIFGGDAGQQCDHCLPDCVSTIYSSSVSATPLRRCDTKSIGMSTLCKFTEDLPHPRIWSEQVVNEYKRIYPGEPLPDFIQEFSDKSARRQFIDPKKLRKEAVFEGLYEDAKGATYNAFERDIAVVHFFFQEPTVFQFRRSLRMTWIDFIGQIGGVLGLCIGFSLLSGVEILYWFTLRLSHRICCPRNQDSIKRVQPIDENSGSQVTISTLGSNSDNKEPYSLG